MTELQLAHLLQTAATVIVGCVVWFWMIPAIRLDSLRQKLFTTRDELFDFAMEGSISFNDPAYGLLRDQMNGLIRYAHHLTVFRALMTVGMRQATGGANKMDWNVAWGKATSNIKSDDVRNRMKSFHDRATTIVLIHLVTGSPLLFTAMCVTMLSVGLANVAAGGVVGLRQLARMASRKVLQGPLDLRLIEEAAVCEPA